MTSVPDDVAQLLTSEPLMAHLATCVDGRPHVAPVWYDYDADDEIIEVLTTGRKLENIRANPRVAISIQKDIDGHAQWRVTLLGTATIVEDETAKQEATRRINAKYGTGDQAWPKNRLVRITVGTTTAREY